MAESLNKKFIGHLSVHQRQEMSGPFPVPETHTFKLLDILSMNILTVPPYFH